METTEKEKEKQESADIEPLRMQYETAQTRLEQQAQTMDSFSDTAKRMFRMILVVIGALTSGVIYLHSGSDSTVSFTLTQNIYAAIGSIFLVASALSYLIGQGKEVQKFRSVCVREDINPDKNVSEQRFLKDRLDSYKTRIDENDQVISGIRSIHLAGTVTFGVAILSFGIVTIEFLFGTGIALLLFVALLIAYWKYYFYYKKQLPEDFQINLFGRS